MGPTKLKELEDRNVKAMSAADPLYERINKAWSKAEEYIQVLGVLSPVEFQYDKAAEGWYMLGVQKRNGKWRICYGEGVDEDDISWTLISDCSLTLRIELVAYLNFLIEEVVKTNERILPELQKSVEYVESSLKKLGIL